MTMTRKHHLPLLAVLLLGLSACATVPDGEEERMDPDDPDAAEIDGVDDVGDVDEPRVIRAEDCPPDCPFERDAIEQPDSLLAERVIYFEFDSSRVQSEYRDVLRRHAEYLTRYSDVDVRLEGHTDERGSREYNIGLGERRAEAVKDMLRAYGVSRQQMETVSYGEEIPAVDASNEEAWEQNRRVEIRY
jgi:peptidoglycan-associated lipoprotein